MLQQTLFGESCLPFALLPEDVSSDNLSDISLVCNCLLVSGYCLQHCNTSLPPAYNTTELQAETELSNTR
jgi:hypothetical protein